jgi:fatty acyl-CoA reductase
MAEELTPRFIQDRPNTYTFTKSVAECLVASEAANIPAIILRPSIVGPTWKEPIPGWVDNFNGMPILICLEECMVVMLLIF